MNVAIIGTGYVGLTTGVALAFLGHRIQCVDKDPAKIELLRNGQSPIHEIGVQELMHESAARLSYTDSIAEAVRDAEVILIAVGTPQTITGQADTQYVEQAAREVAEGVRDGGIYTLVVKSTVPIGSGRRVALVVRRTLRERGVDATVYMASNPEFLREGNALHDTLYPDRIVAGADTEDAIEMLRRLYQPILEQDFAPPTFLPRPDGYHWPPLVTTDATSAEMIKYAANAFLALKISYMNEIAGLCERVGADVTEVSRGIGLDHRIGQPFLQAGLGWGGSCFPKDTSAMLAVASEYNYNLSIVQASRDVNARQRRTVVEKLQSELKVLRGRTIGVLGLAFKPNTDDVREAPAMDIIRHLVESGAHVRAHDPIAAQAAATMLEGLDVELMDGPYDVAMGADALVLATEWDEYRNLDLRRLQETLASPVLVDGRNMYDPAACRAAGLTYLGVGR